MKTPKNVNERIDEMLMDSGMTNHELASRIGKHSVTIDRILSGATENPSYGTIKSIAEALNCHIEYLLKGTGPKKMELKQDNPWKDEAYIILKDELKEWKLKHTQAMEMVGRLIDRVSPGKHNGFMVPADNRRSAVKS